MANGGRRIAFYQIDGEEVTVDDLADELASGEETAIWLTTQTEIHRFVEDLFKVHPIGSLTHRNFQLPQSYARKIVLWARVLGKLRMIIDGPGAEQPRRGMIFLRDLAFGHALIHGRYEVNDDDVALVEHVVLSSGFKRQTILRALFKNGGIASTPELAKLSGLCTERTLTYMEELIEVGLVRYAQKTPKRIIRLVPEFAELLVKS
jgi:hypothetical protein